MPNAASSCLVLEPFRERAVIQAARRCLADLGCNPTLAVVFVSADYRAYLPDFLELIQLHAHASLLVGSSASGLIGTGYESEKMSGFSLMLLSMPETRITEMTFTESDADEFSPDEWRDAAGDGVDSEAWLVFTNPLAMDSEFWLRNWSQAFGNAPTLGGLSSGGERGDDIFVFKNREVIEAGVAIGLKGGIKLHTIISQGCRPFGEPLPITGAHENVITSIGARPPLEHLSEAINSLSPDEKVRSMGNILAGLALTEYMDEFKTGDFLVRTLLGMDNHSGNIAIGTLPRLGQTLQFQLRDKHSANDELRRMLWEKRDIRPMAAFLFTCRGRGANLFGSTHHDARAIEQTFGNIPLAGFFCNGEIGPVRAQNFVHGYTAAIGLLE